MWLGTTAASISASSSQACGGSPVSFASGAQAATMALLERLHRIGWREARALRDASYRLIVASAEVPAPILEFIVISKDGFALEFEGSTEDHV
jgi:hypothetical protein